MSTAAANNSGLAEEQVQASKLLEFARQHCSQHNYRAAIDAIQAGMALARGDEVEMLAQLYATLANAQMALGQAELASVNYKAALRLSPHLAGCWCNLGAAYMQQGKADAAVAYFLQAIELSPDLSSMTIEVSGGCGPNAWRGPWGHCRDTPYYGRLPNGSYKTRGAWNGCPPGSWRGPYGHCRNTPFHGRLPNGSWV